MYLTSDQLIRLFNIYLREYLLPKSFNHIDLFDEYRGGNILKRRLWLVLRDPKYSYLIQGDSIQLLETFRIAREFLRKNKMYFIVGLNYEFTERDLDELERIYRENFI